MSSQAKQTPLDKDEVEFVLNTLREKLGQLDRSRGGEVHLNAMDLRLLSAMGLVK